MTQMPEAHIAEISTRLKDIIYALDMPHVIDSHERESLVRILKDIQEIFFRARTQTTQTTQTTPAPASPPLERDPVSGETQATKHDGTKNRLGLFPIRAFHEACRVFTWAATAPGKYSEGNWKEGSGFRWSRLLDAGMGHRNSWALGEDLDTESHFHHLAHSICCDSMLLEHCLTGHGTDDRATRQIVRREEIDENLLCVASVPYSYHR